MAYARGRHFVKIRRHTGYRSMAKSGKKEAAGEAEVNICRNRRAIHDYEIHDRIECGIALVGTEVKSLRDGFGNLEDAFARLDGREAWLHGAESPEYVVVKRVNPK